MFTRELSRIKAVQKRSEYARHGRTQINAPLSFEQWFLKGIRKHEAEGVEFEFLPGLVKITWPEKSPVLRTVEDFNREYNTEYLARFIPVCTLPFEENAGVC